MRRPIYDTVRMHVPYDRVAAVVREGPGAWLPDDVTPDAGGRVWHVPMSASGVLAATVDALVEVGLVEETPGLLVLPLSWRAVRAEAAFPRLHADLELEYVTADLTRATLVGSYKPPLSVVGAAADRVVGHVVAEGVVRDFLERVAARIDTAATRFAGPTLRS